MKFCLYAIGTSALNGAYGVMSHIGHALEELGHEAVVLSLGQPLPEDAEVVWFQSQGYGTIKRLIGRRKIIKICWLEHFNPDFSYFPYDRIKDIEADYYNTQYRGPVKDWAESQVKKEVIYLSHGACLKCMKPGKQIDVPDKIIVCNRMKWRKEDWLNYAGVKIINVSPSEVNDAYSSARAVCNMHAEFQKGLTDDYFGMRGMGMNERVYQAIMAGTICISDNNPIVKEYFNEDEVPYCTTMEEYKEKSDYYVEHQEKAKECVGRARKKIIENYLYKDIIKNYLEKISLI